MLFDKVLNTALSEDKFYNKWTLTQSPVIVSIRQVSCIKKGKKNSS